MNADELKALGITDEDVIKKIIISHGKDIETHKTQIETLTTEKGTLSSQLEEATKQIEGFKDMKKPEEVEAAVKEWQTKLEQAQAESQKALEKVKYDTAIENALRDAKARKVAAARALLDEKDLKFGEDGQIAGLDERVKKVVSENSWAFGDDETKPKPPRVVTKTTSVPPEPDDKMDRVRREAAGLPVKEK